MHESFPWKCGYETGYEDGLRGAEKNLFIPKNFSGMCDESNEFKMGYTHGFCRGQRRRFRIPRLMKLLEMATGE